MHARRSSRADVRPPVPGHARVFRRARTHAPARVSARGGQRSAPDTPASPAVGHPSARRTEGTHAPRLPLLAGPALPHARPALGDPAPRPALSTSPLPPLHAVRCLNAPANGFGEEPRFAFRLLPLAPRRADAGAGAESVRMRTQRQRQLRLSDWTARSPRCTRHAAVHAARRTVRTRGSSWETGRQGGREAAARVRAPRLPRAARAPRPLAPAWHAAAGRGSVREGADGDGSRALPGGSPARARVRACAVRSSRVRRRHAVGRDGPTTGREACLREGRGWGEPSITAAWMRGCPGGVLSILFCGRCCVGGLG